MKNKIKMKNIWLVIFTIFIISNIYAIYHIKNIIQDQIITINKNLNHQIKIFIKNNKYIKDIKHSDIQCSIYHMKCNVNNINIITENNETISISDIILKNTNNSYIPFFKSSTNNIINLNLKIKNIRNNIKIKNPLDKNLFNNLFYNELSNLNINMDTKIIKNIKDKKLKFNIYNLDINSSNIKNNIQLNFNYYEKNNNIGLKNLNIKTNIINFDNILKKYYDNYHTKITKVNKDEYIKNLKIYILSLFKIYNNKIILEKYNNLIKNNQDKIILNIKSMQKVFLFKGIYKNKLDDNFLKNNFKVNIH